MSLSESLSNVGRAIAFHPALVKPLGGINAVLFFEQIFYWQRRSASDVGVYKSAEEIEQETGMTYREQATARKQLVDRGIMIETHRRLEHRIYYRIDLDALDRVWNLANDENAIRETTKAQPDELTKAQFDELTNPQFVEQKITQEITQKITYKKRAPADAPGFDEAWSHYPSRPGRNKADALKAWNARVKEGESPDAMIAGTKRYAEFCRKMRTEGRYIKQPATFYGPSKHYLDDFSTGRSSTDTSPADAYAGDDVVSQGGF